MTRGSAPTTGERLMSSLAVAVGVMLALAVPRLLPAAGEDARPDRPAVQRVVLVGPLGLRTVTTAQSPR